MSISIKKQTSYSNVTYYQARSIEYIVIHYTAGTTSRSGTAYNTALMFSNPSICASADFIVDDSQIVQFNPDIGNYYCWHCGDNKNYTKGGSFYGKCRNSNSIGIEVCSSNSTGTMTAANDSSYYFTNAVVENAVKLTQHLMKLYNIPAERVIRHYDVSGKFCPGIIGWNADSGSEIKWKEFKKQLGNAGTETEDEKKLYRVQIGAYKNRSNAEAQLKKAREKGFKDAFIKVSGGFFKVQAGAFAVYKNAESLCGKLKNSGFKDSFIV